MNIKIKKNDFCFEIRSYGSRVPHEFLADFAAVLRAGDFKVVITEDREVEVAI